MPTDNPLALPATPERLRAVAEPARLDDRAVARGIEIVAATPSSADWRQFLARTLALLGTALALSGAVCFVAYNWNALGRFARMGLAAAAITAAALVAWRTLPRLSGQIALAAAAVLVGPLLGVYGQTYQTGADPYELFLGWLVLILPWLVAARFAPLWVFAAALLDLTLGLYWAQVRQPGLSGEWLYLPLLIAGVHTVLVTAWELQLASREPWFAEPWAAHALALTGWLALVLAVNVTLFVPKDAGLAGLLALVATGACFGLTWHWHRNVRTDRLMIAGAVTALLAMLTGLAGRIIFQDLDLEFGGGLFMALIIVGEVALGLRWYRGPRSADATPGG